MCEFSSYQTKKPFGCGIFSDFFFFFPRSPPARFRPKEQLHGTHHRIMATYSSFFMFMEICNQKFNKPISTLLFMTYITQKSRLFILQHRRESCILKWISKIDVKLQFSFFFLPFCFFVMTLLRLIAYLTHIPKVLSNSHIFNSILCGWKKMIDDSGESWKCTLDFWAY